MHDGAFSHLDRGQRAERSGWLKITQQLPSDLGQPPALPSYTPNPGTLLVLIQALGLTYLHPHVPKGKLCVYSLMKMVPSSRMQYDLSLGAKLRFSCLTQFPESPVNYSL